MGLVRGVARTAAIAGTATAVSNRVSRRQAGRWAEQEQQQTYATQQQPVYQQPAYQEPPPQPAPPAQPTMGAEQATAPDMSAKLAQLEQLGSLHSQGILSDYEFEAQKRKILEG
jgi:putative oligomerization/nucleic acid binding protein